MFYKIIINNECILRILDIEFYNIPYNISNIYYLYSIKLLTSIVSNIIYCTIKDDDI